MDADTPAVVDTIRPGDVFRFSYKPEVRAAIDEKWYAGHTHHCFDGQLVAKDCDGRVLLLDTYWSFGNDGCAKYFTVDQAREQGELEFICNLDDVIPAEEEDTLYYSAADVFNLSYQHGCYKKFALRKGAVRSQAVMRATLIERIAKAKADAAWQERRVKEFTEALAKVEAGDTSVYIYN